jgi:hypothetical protein
MKDDLNFAGYGKRPQFFSKWKTTSIFQEMEENLHLRISNRTSMFRIWKRTSINKGMEDDFKFSGNRTQL